jgi:hypothetical protein
VEEWKFEFEWLQIRHAIKDKLNKSNLPDLNAILFLIGIQELGEVREGFTKEEKQDLIHIAVCRLLSSDGYFEFVGLDAEGWPHWKPAKALKKIDVKSQEKLLKEKIISYFNELESPEPIIY